LKHLREKGPGHRGPRGGEKTRSRNSKKEVARWNRFELKGERLTKQGWGEKNDPGEGEGRTKST